MEEIFKSIQQSSDIKHQIIAIESLINEFIKSNNISSLKQLTNKLLNGEISQQV
jgi:hypothetical protein